MDELHYVFDPKLRVLGLFNLLTPGPLHNALARAAAQGARLITVNTLPSGHLQECTLHHGPSTCRVRSIPI